MVRLPALLFAALLFSAGCSESVDPTRGNDFVPLTAITITSQYNAAAARTQNQFTAIGDYSGAFSDDITDAVLWSSDDEGVLAVSNAPGREGLATAGSLGGTARVTARSGEVVASTTFEVTDAKIAELEVTPASASVTAGLTRQFAARGIFDDGSVQDLTRVAAWTSQDEGVASIGEEGLAAGLSEGETSITALFDGTSGAASLAVTEALLESLAVTPANLERPAGLTIPYTLTATFTDGSTADVTAQAVWDSSSAIVATVSNTAGSIGEVKTLVAGGTTISAQYSGEEASAELDVNSETLEILEMSPEDETIVVGATLQFALTGSYSGATELDLTEEAVWESSDPEVATIGTGEEGAGLTRGIDTGKVDIKATFGGLTETTSLTVEN